MSPNGIARRHIAKIITILGYFMDHQIAANPLVNKLRLILLQPSLALND